ncbi:hypothetical protein ACLM5J_09720 [Nocardioides sp. Bht2]|uniref:hypothetical protein n=1 Tax=Nocardioides sp. Bht2 TaxID=3392297 RepID=UPI0039B63938
MGVRTETVRLELQDAGFTSGAARAAAATAVLEQALDRVDGTSLRASKGLDTSAGSVDQLGASARRNDRSINQLTGRLALLRDAIAILGPTTVPMGAAAVAGFAGLAGQVGAAVLGAGTLLVAFQGVGDALSAVNDAALEPTAENLTKARQAMEELSPAAQGLVAQIQQMRPALRDLRDAAAGGALDGLTDSLTALEGRLPEVERILSVTGDTVGDLLAVGGESLASDGWTEFFDYLATDAQPTLVDLGYTVGNLARGLAELGIATDPLSRDFSVWLRESSADFAAWADGLAETENYREFIDYVRETGPQLGETLGEAADALLQIAEAASPLGGPVLQALEAAARVIGTIADSDLGTPLVAGFMALSAYNRALAVTEAVQGRIAARGGMGAIIGVGASGSSKATLRQDLAAWSDGLVAWGKDAEKAAEATERLKQRRNALLRSGALAGGVALSTTDLVQGMDIANTASLGFMGALVGGGTGAVVGGLTGAVMDYNAAADKASSAQRALANAWSDSDGTMTGYLQNLERAQSLADDFANSVSSPNLLSHLAKGFTPGGLANNLDVIFGGVESSALGKIADQSILAEQTAGDLDLALRLLAQDLGIVGDHSDASLGDMNATLVKLSPAMQGLGITVEDLISSIQDGTFPQVADDLGAWISTADSASGRTGALANALQGLDNEFLTTADSASVFASALDALLSPQMDQERAAIAWRESLRTLKDDLSETTRSLEEGKGDQNRSAILDRLQALQNTAVADAMNGASGAELAQTLRKGKKELLDFADAAGLNRREVKKMIAEMNLTPETIRTLLEVTGGDDARATIDDLTTRLVDLGLTEAEATAAINDVASGKIKTVQGLVDKYGLSKAEAKALLKDAASEKIRAALALLRQMDGYSANATITTTHITRQVAENMFKHKPKGAPGNADGGTIPKDGLPYADRYHYMLAPGEEVISNRRGQADRFRPLLKAINAAADGATVGPSAGIGKAMQLSFPGLHREYDMTARSLKGLRRAVTDSEKALDKATDRRDAIASKRSDVMGAVRNTFTSQLFGNEVKPWFEQSANPVGLLNQDITGLRQFAKARKTLAKKGLDGGALDALFQQGNLQEIQAMAGMSKAELAKYEKKYELRERLLGQQSRGAGDQVYGAELASANKELRGIRQDNRRLEKRLAAIEKHTRENAKKTGDQINKTATKGRRNAR